MKPEVLIIAKNAAYIGPAADILQAAGAHVRIAADSGAGFQLACRYLPALAVLEAADVPCTEFCTKLRSKTETCKIPVLVVSDTLPFAACVCAGANDLIRPSDGAEAFAARVKPYLAYAQAQNAAGAAVQERNQFCYAAAHDLKAPMQNIAQLGSLIDSGELPPAETEEAKKLLYGCTQTAQQLIDRLLKVSRVCSRSLVPKAVDLNPLFDRAAQQLQEREPKRHVELCREMLPWVWMDPDMAVCIVWEALSNSWKFTRNCPAPKIAVTCSSSGGMLQLQIADNGAGFDESCSQHLFELFSRLHTEKEFEGSGAGLFIIRTIAVRAGGTAQLHALPRGGAVLSLSLPACGEKTAKAQK
ncbi:MAG: ATP-binding protein [Oscillospiraceae bacterium]|jgi:signal transduction histidine kinase|nr:ATP-binding protein [Oscillospiraceae bacterium]